MDARQWIGVDPHVAPHERVHHAVPAASAGTADVIGWQMAACGLRVALLLQRRMFPQHGGEPLPFDGALSTACPECLIALAHSEPDTAGVTQLPRGRQEHPPHAV